MFSQSNQIESRNKFQKIFSIHILMEYSTVAINSLKNFLEKYISCKKPARIIVISILP